MPRTEQIQMTCEKVETWNGQLVVHLYGERWWEGASYRSIMTIRTHMNSAESWIVGEIYNVTVERNNE